MQVSRSPYDPVPGPGKNVGHIFFPCSLIGNIHSCYISIPESAKVSIPRGKEARSILYPADMVTLTVENEEAKTGILAAEIGTGMMGGAAGMFQVLEPEKRACHRTDLPDILRAEKIRLVWIKDNHPLFPGNREADPEVHGIDPVFDADDVPHVTATFPALLTPECHRWSP
jgi:hypothetical protein